MKYNDRSEFEKVDSFGIGAPNDAYAQYFIGNSFKAINRVWQSSSIYGKCNF